MRVVGPLLFQATFNYALYPPVPGRSYRLSEFAPVGCRRFTNSSRNVIVNTNHP